MLRFLADENFEDQFLQGIRAEVPALDIKRVQEVNLAGADDPLILACAAEDGRLLLTHDAATMPKYTYVRVDQGLSMPGVVVIRLKTQTTLRAIVNDVALLAQCSRDGEWEGQVLYLPY